MMVTGSKKGSPKRQRLVWLTSLCKLTAAGMHKKTMKLETSGSRRMRCKVLGTVLRYETPRTDRYVKVAEQPG